MCVCVLVLQWETLEVNTRLDYYNKLSECRELVFSLAVTGRLMFLKGISGFTTKSLISLLFVHGFSPNKKIYDL